MFTIKLSLHLAVLLLATSFAFIHCSLERPVAVDQFADNAADKGQADALTMHKRPSFFLGSRYGRSGAPSASQFASSKTRRLNVVPRNDRFFLGSRYGKRGGSGGGEDVSFEYQAPPTPYEQTLLADGAVGAAGAADAAASGPLHLNNKSSQLKDRPGSAYTMMMSCVYTGLKDYYRCSNIEELTNIINQLTIATKEGAVVNDGGTLADNDDRK